MTPLTLPIATLVLAFGLGSVPAAAAEDAHTHGTHTTHATGLTLDHGRKWQTDAPLRQGMSAIGQDIRQALGRIHAKRYADADYDALAGQLGRRIDDITRDCHLPEAADAQLHMVLVEVMDGIEAMKKAGGDRSRGVVAIVKALDRYQAHFDHPGWEPLRH